MKGTVAGVNTVYIGAHFEWSGATSTMKKYYYAGSVRVAVRTGDTSGAAGLLWLLGDHLGSTSRVANADGTAYSNGDQRYKPWGEKRYPTGVSGLPTTFRFTGQRQETGLGAAGGEGLYYYGARWYDSSLGRFISADTIIPNPGDSQSWDRYAYVGNNPLKYTDPSGHDYLCDEECEDDGWKPTPKSSTPTTKLTSRGKKIDALYGKAKAWYGKKFGLVDFIALAFSREFMSLNLEDVDSIGDPLRILQHAITHRAYMNCAANNGNQACSSLSQNAIFNFIGRFSQSVWVIYNHIFEGIGTFNNIVPTIKPAAWGVAQSLINPINAEWKLTIGQIGDHPANYGNDSMYENLPGGSIENYLAGLGMPLIWVYGSEGQDLAYVFTVNQSNALSKFKK